MHWWSGKCLTASSGKVFTAFALLCCSYDQHGQAVNMTSLNVNLGATKSRLALAQLCVWDWLCNLQSPAQNEIIGPFVQKSGSEPFLFSVTLSHGVMGCAVLLYDSISLLAQAVPELPMQPRLASNSQQFSCLSSPNAGIMGLVGVFLLLCFLNFCLMSYHP